jgi:UDP-glucose 4-epimerase
MKILFTGSSSFSGTWFIRELVKSGHHVTAIFQQTKENYTGTRRQRVDHILPLCNAVFETTFGDEKFLDVIHSTNEWNLFCHHASDVVNYKSPNFDPINALAKNTNNLKTVLCALQEKGCNKILLTGSVFEQKEGTGSEPLRAFSPYGLSKGLTSDIFTFQTALLKMKLGKFVIPNPFGPYEEGRFTTYLAQTWLQEKVATVNTPLYIRDNIPISLLSKAYVHFANRLTTNPGFEKYNPSCYVESQGTFTHRFANELRHRLNLKCEFELKNQEDFLEPMTRINTEPLNWSLFNWNEAEAWDELAHYYKGGK